MKKTAIIVAVVFSVFWGLWLIAVPEGFITHFIENSLRKSGMKIEAEGVEKGLFYSLRAKDINVTGGDNSPIVTIKDVEAGINFTSLIKLTPRIDFHGAINKGKVNGSISLKGAEGVSEIKGRDINIHDIPALERRLGIHGTGTLTFDFRQMNNRREIKFSLRDANIRASGLLPLDMFQKAQGALVIEKEIVSVKSLSLEGRGIYARVKGDIRGKKQGLKMEVMVDSSSQSEPSPLKIPEQFKVSPGYYVL
ncbi:MAG: type II secretion system protein GspN, partial [Syntrophales bacterium]|nr:type II secretion system protein GspN [Syntrophales bacterium]